MLPKYVLRAACVAAFLCSFPSLRAQQDDAASLADTLAAEADTLWFQPDNSLLYPADMQQQLQALLTNPVFERTQLGLMVYDLSADSLIFACGERQLLRPASTEKLLTAIAALTRLGGSYQFKTGLYRLGAVADTVLLGDLYIKGGFDPRFGSDDMRAFAEALVRQGIRRIAGRIVFDVSMKDTLAYGEGWCWDDEAVRLTPLLFGGKDSFPAAFFEALATAGIASSNEYMLGVTPREALLLATRFHTLDQILMRMIKQSDNLYAEAMFYQLGAQTGEPYPAAKASQEGVNALIRELGLQPAHYRIADGSGLSLYNYVTAELLVKALRYAYERNNIYLHLYPALPIAGVDGTLARRMRQGPACNNVRAKTGTVEGVSALAGYATASNGHVLAFAILNQGLRNAATGRAFQDRVCRVLTGF